jgi:hypothetical protein
MSRATVVRYTTRPDAADENARLIRAVFAELATAEPDGMRYASYRLDDGVGFVHVAVFDGDDNPLERVGAFREFASGVQQRCAEGPVASGASTVGSYPSGESPA